MDVCLWIFSPFYVSTWFKEYIALRIYRLLEDVLVGSSSWSKYSKVVSPAFDLLVKVALAPCSANLLGTDLILLELGLSSLVVEEEDELLEVVGELLMEVGMVV